MNCKNCKQKCKAECCGPVPFDKKFTARHAFIRDGETLDLGTTIIAVDKDGYCRYLTEDLECSVYEDRPEVCRTFGSDRLPCKWQDSDGRMRSRQERRQIEREYNKKLNKLT